MFCPSRAKGVPLDVRLEEVEAVEKLGPGTAQVRLLLGRLLPGGGKGIQLRLSGRKRPLQFLRLRARDQFYESLLQLTSLLSPRLAAQHAREHC